MRCLPLVAFPGLLFMFLTSAIAAEWRSPHPPAVEEAAPMPLIPFPREAEWHNGSCSAKTLIKRVKNKSLGREDYILRITPNDITVEASSDAGIFYAARTLEQLKKNGHYPCCLIKDGPAFPVRCFMHDTGRNFRSIESLKEDIDELARLKMNAFHWHLTDHPAWRIECKKYPVLNAPSKRIKDRDVNDTYSYEQIRQLFRYAKARHVQIIPEIDMPGHSTYFNNCFGFAMHSPQGMAILEELLEEFCREIPQEICPYLHIGADEIRIPNAKQFADKMSAKVKSLGRQPIQWAGIHDLPVSDNSYAQLWTDENTVAHPDPKTQKRPYFDSTAGYVNSFDPAILVRRIFFRRPCGTVKGDNHALGVILCLWPDTRVADKNNIPIQSPQWPALYAMAERSWKGAPVNGAHLAGQLPERGTEAFRAFELFEKRMERLLLTKRYPFPYWRDTFMDWTLTGPVPDAKAPEIRAALLNGEESKDVQRLKARGGNLYFRTRAGNEGLFNATAPGHTVWAQTTLYAEKDCTVYAMVGFDAPARSTRRCTGVPAAGEWSQCGTLIWLNGVKIANPQTYKLAGQRRYEKHTWHDAANELPFENEEFWWARDPVPFKLKAGANTLLIEQPYTGPFQSWGISFIPVEKSGSRWIAAPQYASPGHNAASPPSNPPPTTH